MDISKKIKDYIQKYFNNSDFIDLEFQKKEIYRLVTIQIINFFNRCLIDIPNYTEKKDNEEHKNPDKGFKEIKKYLKLFNLKNDDPNIEGKLEKNFKNNFNTFFEEIGENKKIFGIANLDVGLGKTLIGLISAKVLIDILFDLNNYFSKETIKELKNDRFKSLRQFKYIIKEFENDGKTQLNIVTKKNLEREFKNIINKLGIKNKIRYFSSGNIIKSEEEKKLEEKDSGISLYLDEGFNFSKMINHFTETLRFHFIIFLVKENNGFEATEDFQGIGLENNEDFDKKINNLFSSSVFIIDEWGTDKMFFKDGNSFLNMETSTDYLFGFGLIGDKEVADITQKSQNYYQFIASDFVLKKDVIDELVTKGLYNQDSFLYKNIIIKSKKLDDYFNYFNNISKEFKNIHELGQNKIKDMNKIGKFLYITIDEFNKGIISYDNFIKNLNNLKSIFKKEFSNFDFEKLYNNITKIKKEIIQIKSQCFYKKTILEMIENNSLDYSLEKKTIIILDDKWDNSHIEKLRESIKKKNIKLFSVDSGRNNKEDNGILIGRVSDIARGLNLQHFDTIMFIYFNEFKLDEIHQSIGRLDRIGTINEKEVIFLSFLNNEDLLNNIIKKRKEISSNISIEDILIKDNNIELENKKMIKKMETEMKKNDKIYEVYKKNKIKNKEMFKENKDLLKDILNDLSEQYKKYNKFSSLFIEKSNKYNNEDVNSKYIKNVLGILDK